MSKDREIIDVSDGSSGCSERVVKLSSKAKDIVDDGKSALDDETKKSPIIIADDEKEEDAETTAKRGEWRPEQLLAIKRGHEKYGFIPQKWPEVKKDPIVGPILSNKTTHQISSKWTHCVRKSCLTPVVSPLVCQGESQMQMANDLDKFFKLKDHFLEVSKDNSSMRELPPYEPVPKEMEGIMVSRHNNPDEKLVSTFFSAVSKLHPSEYAFHKLCLVNLDCLKFMFQKAYGELLSQQVSSSSASTAKRNVDKGIKPQVDTTRSNLGYILAEVCNEVIKDFRWVESDANKIDTITLSLLSEEEKRLLHMRLNAELEIVRSNIEQVKAFRQKEPVASVSGNLGGGETSAKPHPTDSIHPASGTGQRKGDTMVPAESLSAELRLTNIPQGIPIDDLIAMFEVHGSVEKFSVDKPSGVVYVSFKNRKEATRAMNEMNGYGHGEEKLKVQWSV